MVLSRWRRDGRTAEVLENPPRHFVAWDIERGKYAVETETGRSYFDSQEELEDALAEAGWKPL